MVRIHSLANRPSVFILTRIFVAPRNSLFDSPIQSQICDRKRRYDVKSLSSASPPGIEDCRIECAGKRTLAVGGDGVGCYALLCLRPWLPWMLAICAGSCAIAIWPRRTGCCPRGHESIAGERGSCKAAYLYCPRYRGICNITLVKDDVQLMREIGELKHVFG